MRPGYGMSSYSTPYTGWIESGIGVEGGGRSKYSVGVARCWVVLPRETTLHSQNSDWRNKMATIEEMFFFNLILGAVIYFLYLTVDGHSDGGCETTF